MVTRRRLPGGAVKVPFGVGRGRFGGFLVDFGRFEVGEPCRTRTYNLEIKSLLLYQLS